MREIKFRGWDNENKKWRYGHFFETVEGIMRCYNIVEDREIRYYCLPQSIGQFTELIDKNGKEIYECDILKRPDSEINYIVVFNGGCFCIQDSENKHHNLTLLGGINIFLEIIGNTYKNPELLNNT